MDDAAASLAASAGTVALSHLVAARVAEEVMHIRAVARDAEVLGLSDADLERWRMIGGLGPDATNDPVLLRETAGLLQRLEELHHRELLYRHRVRLPLDPILGRDVSAEQLAEPPPGPMQFDIPPSDHRYEVLGHRVRLPFGIPSSVLTSSIAWIEYFFDAGYNIITTRTLRSDRNPGYDPPNFFLTDSVTGRVGRRTKVVAPTGSLGSPIEQARVSSVNSYGIPSDPNEWLPQIDKLASRERDGQLLVVSVVGQGTSDEEIINDFLAVGRMAAEAGARVLEANLSFLRRDRDGSRRYSPYCHDHGLTVRIMCALAEELSLRYNVALVAKLSHMRKRRLKSLANALAPIVSGFSGINAMPVRVVDESGAPYFPDRPTPPLLAGAAIHSHALEFVRTLKSVRDKSAFWFDIIGIGGVMSAADVIQMRAAGADAVMSSTGVTRDPFLGWDVAMNEDAFRAAR